MGLGFNLGSIKALLGLLLLRIYGNYALRPVIFRLPQVLGGADLPLDRDRSDERTRLKISLIASALLLNALIIQIQCFVRVNIVPHTPFIPTYREHLQSKRYHKDEIIVCLKRMPSLKLYFSHCSRYITSRATIRSIASRRLQPHSHSITTARHRPLSPLSSRLSHHPTSLHHPPLQHSRHIATFAMDPTETDNKTTSTTTTFIKSFDRKQFDRQVHVTGLKIPAQQCQSVVRVLSKHILRDTKTKPIIDAPGGSKQHKLLLLDPGISPSDLETIKITTAAAADDDDDDNDKDASQTIQQFLSSFHHSTDNDNKSSSIQILSHSITLGYDSMSLSEALSHLLPPHIRELPSSFETVGHIAHLNLRDELLPWKHVIGQVLLDKNPKIKTVINKTGAIENEWRVLPMEVIAGENQTVTEMKQHNARFRLNYATVYWNSRLEGEHKRMVDRYFQPGDVILDAMAGIGPFAVPAALKGCTVYANDLNPESYRWLRENAAVNKVNDKLKAYMLDGREVIRLAAGRKLPPPAVPLVCVKGEMKEHKKEREGGNELFQHVIMNLPATAVEFLDAFNGAFDRQEWKDVDLPMVHVYAFLRGDEELKDLQCRAEKALGGSLLVTEEGGDNNDTNNNNQPEFYLVREVAPNKSMYCLSFRVPSAIAFGDSKRQKV